MFATETLVRDVYCPIEHLHRNMEIARAVTEGRFTHAGVTLNLGAEPPWADLAVHPDRDWWIEWSKFYFGLDLAHAFAVTGDEVFLRTWEGLVRAWVAQVPPDFGPTDAIGRRLQNWIYAWSAFRRVTPRPPFEAAFEHTLIEAIGRQAAYLEANLTPERNHRTLELYALLVVALALPELAGADERRQFAWDALQENLFTDFRADGVHREHSTHYHMVALRSMIAARENARRFALPISADFDRALARAAEFAMWCQRPDGSIPALSDSDTGDYRDLLRRAADLLGRADMLYVASNGREGSAPASRGLDLTRAGYFVRRNDWNTLGDSTALQRHMLFDCGAVGDGGHGHYDALHLELWAGRPLIVDPGRYTYAEGTPNWRHWFKSTAAHNTVCVDGLDQTSYRAGKPRKDQIAEARSVTTLASPLMDVIGGEVRSPLYDAIHMRHVFFVDGDYWIVLDELSASSTHHYDLRFHLSDDAQGSVKVHGEKVVAPAFELHCAQGGQPVLEDGWVSPRYGVRLPAPVVSIRQQGTRVRFVSVIVPRDPHRRRGDIRTAVNERSGGALTVKIDGIVPGTTDRLTWSDRGAPFFLGPITGTACGSWTRMTPQGDVLGFTACGLLHDQAVGDDWIAWTRTLGLQGSRRRKSA